jgi:Ca2+-binding RTX toxin-like protein
VDRRALRRCCRLVTAALLATVAPIVTATPALAVTFDFSGGTMTITGTSAPEIITVTCTAGTLQAGSDSGVACGNVQRLVVKPLGGDDTVNLAGVTAANFPAIDSCKVVTGPGDDDVQTSKVDDTVLTGNGNDIVRPNGGHDAFDAGSGGFDQLISANGHDQTMTNTSYDGLGHAQLKGFESASLGSGGTNDRLDATGWTKQGYVSMSGGDGDDVILGGPVGEQLSGEAGSDTVKGFGGNDNLQGDAGATPEDDTLLGGPGYDQVYAIIYGQPVVVTNTEITDLGAHDTIASIQRMVVAPHFSFAGPVNLDGHGFDGDLAVQGTSMADTVEGGSGDDRFTSGNGADTYIGHGGTDEMSILLAGAGSINVSAAAVTSTSAGSKTITGVDEVDGFGDSSAQTFGSSAFPGKVTFRGGGGNDGINGNGAGTTFVLDSSSTSIVVSAGGISSSAETITFSSVGHLIISVSSGGSIDAHLFGGRVALYGGNGADSLIGTPKADELIGYGDADSLEGRGGDDTLWGATGPDMLDGGPGFDRCDDTAADTVTSCEGNAPPLGD